MTISIPTPEILAERDICAWDEAADVVVVGYGGAGASAAIEARGHGVDVLVVERASGGGGATGIAGGHVYLGGGTPVQTACGFEDTAEEMYKYLDALTPDPHPTKLRLYCEESVAHFHWLEACGVPFERSYYPGKAAMQPGSECLIWSGNEKAWPFRDKAKPAPRGHKVAFAGGDAGSVLMQRLIAHAASTGVRTLCDARVMALISDNDGTIMGVRVRRFDEVLNIRARAGVVLAAQTGVGDPSVGSTYTLLSLAVPVIGGAILAGGRGSALGCVLGALFVAEVEDFVPFINLPNGGYLIAVGALTVLALIVGSWRSGPSVSNAMSRIVSLRK